MRGREKFAAFLLSAAVLAGAWLLAGSMPAGEAEQAAAMEEADPEALDISPGREGEMTALSWSWDGETVNLRRDGQTRRWVNADDEDCPIDQQAAAALAGAAASVTASMAVPGVKDLAQFGLDAPGLTVIAATAEAAVRYEVGNKSITGEYYLRRDGEDTVYLENGALTAFRVGLTDILALERMPEDIAAVTGLAVQSGAEDYELTYIDTDAGGWFRTDSEEPAALDPERVRGLYETLTELRLERCVTWNAEDLSAYGLDTPQAEAELRYADTEGQPRTAALEFGDYAGGDVYVRFAGSSMVYLVPGAVPDALMYPDWDTMALSTVMNLDIGDISRVRVSVSGKEYRIERQEETVERGEGEDAETRTVYTRGGFVMDPEATEAWLAALADLPTEGKAPAGEGRETFLAVTIEWQDGEAVPAELELRYYDSVHDLCVLGGDQRLLVPRAGAEAAAETAESLFGGR